MGAFLQTVIGWIMASNIAKFFTGVGIAVASHAFLSDYLDDALQAITANAGSADDAMNILLLLGFGQFLSIVGSAALTRASIQAAQKSFGITTQ